MSRARVVVGFGWAGLALCASSCVHDGHPLGTSGAVDVRIAQTTPLFASIDPTGPRQTPFSTNVQLVMTDSSAPAFGGFVFVHVEPPEALTLSSATGELKGPTCQFVDGNFKCIASKEGIANFVATSETSWSGDADLVVTWANLKTDKVVHILPAGLPTLVPSFQVVGINATTHILATYGAVKCTNSSLPADLGTPWRPGAIRSLPLRIVATPPPGLQSVVENAPVTIQALSMDAGLASDPTCATRNAVVVVHLDANGESKEPIFACFDDIGGVQSFAVSSGQEVITPNPTVTVDPEPRLVRVASIMLTTPVSLSPIPLWDVSAYDANRNPIDVPLDLATDGGNILQLSQVTADTVANGMTSTTVSATPKNPGMSSLHVTPRLLSQPECLSAPVTVTAM